MAQKVEIRMATFFKIADMCGTVHEPQDVPARVQLDHPPLWRWNEHNNIRIREEKLKNIHKHKINDLGAYY